MFKFSKAKTDGLDRALIAALDRTQAIIEFKPDGTVLTANANFLAAMGYSLDEIQGRHHRMFCDPAFANGGEYQSFWQRLARGECFSGEYKRIAKGSREIWIQASYNAVVDAAGQVVKVVKLASDITAAKIKAADAQGQIAAVSKTMAVISFTPDGTILDANDNFLKTAGYRLDEIKGKHHSMFVEADFARSADYANMWRSLAAGQPSSGDFRRIGKGGRVVWIQASYNPIFDPSGRVVKVVKFATDVTEKRLFDGVIDQKFGGVVTAIANVTQQTGAAASSVAQATGSMQSVAAGAEELSASIREISSSVVNTKRAVDVAVSDVSVANASTEKLSAGAAAMNSIIDFIQDVASNINLLALNATIESARAGAAGKGFAVVASEVKNLANQVAQATKKISSEIANIQAVSGDVVKALGAIERGMQNVEASVTGVAGAIEEQSAVTREISSNMQMTTGAVKEIEHSLASIRGAAADINAQSQEIQSDFKRVVSI
jgi:methyl-accepting chemotaxis protein